jgi:hypothetical protein
MTVTHPGRCGRRKHASDANLFQRNSIQVRQSYSPPAAASYALARSSLADE